MRRTQPLPPNWRATVRRIIERDHGVCYLCGEPGADSVDHVKAACDGGTDDDSNLAACHWNPCHQRKTAIEANRHHPQHKRKREPERHPGLRTVNNGK